MFHISLFIFFDVLIDHLCFSFDFSFVCSSFSNKVSTKVLQILTWPIGELQPPMLHLCELNIHWKLEVYQHTIPLDNTCEENDVDLNLPPAIIDLIEPQCAPVNKSKGKRKLKRLGCPLQGLHCSKRS
jgi:hypothetical protein